MMNENIYHMLNLLNVFLLVGVMSMNGKGRNAPLYLTKKLLAENVPKAAFDAKNLIVSNALPATLCPPTGDAHGSQQHAGALPATHAACKGIFEATDANALSPRLPYLRCAKEALGERSY